MGRDEPRHECNEPSQDLRETLTAFWGNQLERIQKCAEQQVGKTSKSSTSIDRFRFEPGCSNRN